MLYAFYFCVNYLSPSIFSNNGFLLDPAGNTPLYLTNLKPSRIT